MITIGICDDDSVCLDALYQIISRAMISVSDWKARFFHTSEEVIASIENGDFDCQLIFMDIMLENGAGLSTAQYICNRQINTDMIFVTASREHVFECYHNHACAYLLKPISENDIVLELKRYMENLNTSESYLSVTFQGISHRIPVHSILYIESNLRKLAIHTAQNTYYCYQKLSDIADKLQSSGFIRCHQSYLVAINKIHEFANTHLIIGETSIPVSNRYRGEVKRILEVTSATRLPATADNLGLHQIHKNYGALICVKGVYLGAIIRIRPEQLIQIGRNGEAADMVINLPLVSRIHCSILYHCDTMEYEIMDFSNNGTYVNKNKRLLPGETYLLKPGTELCFGDKETVYKLG